MPATGVRCSFFYSLHNRTITDTFTWVQNVDLEAVVNPAAALMKARLKISGFGVTPLEIRLSKENVFRDSKIVPASLFVADAPKLKNLTSNTGEVTSNAADQPNSCLNVRIDADARHRRQFYLAGIPDCCVATYPTTDPEVQQPMWAPDWQTYKSLLINQQWGFVVQRNEADGVTRVPVVGVTQQVGTGLLGVVVAGPAAFVQGDSVQLRSFRRSNLAYASANGKWRVAQVLTDSPAAGQATVFLLNSANVPASTITSYGTIEKVDFTTMKIVSVEIREPTTRKRGNRSLVGPASRRVRRLVTT